ncbi:MAG: zinc ribbon domain-containing protein [Clostridia bacterium]|nr:zinc ribbon domain-containing protein [Clostridia bacterium]
MEEKTIVEGTVNKETKFCTNCGAEIHADAVICPSCQVSCETTPQADETPKGIKGLLNRFKTDKKFRIISIIAAIVVLASVITIIGVATSNNGTSSGSKATSTSAIIKTTVQNRATVYCILSYENVKNVSVSVTTYEPSYSYDASTYDVYGYVTVTDSYGDKYVGRFNAVVRIEAGEGTCVDFDLTTPTKK